jgi:hypothetical protein
MLNEDDLEGQTGYITDGLEGITALIMDDNILGIELPASVDLEIIETATSCRAALDANLRDCFARRRLLSHIFIWVRSPNHSVAVSSMRIFSIKQV